MVLKLELLSPHRPLRAGERHGLYWESAHRGAAEQSRGSKNGVSQNTRTLLFPQAKSGAGGANADLIKKGLRQLFYRYGTHFLKVRMQT